jgi:hypothetical protein
LPETWSKVGISDIAQKYVVNTLEVLGLGRPATVAPYDLAREASRAEELIAHHLHVVAGLRVDVHDQTPVVVKYVTGCPNPRQKLGEVGLNTRPAVVERGLKSADNSSASPAARSGDQLVLPARQKGRVKIS